MELKYGDTSFPLELPPARLLAVIRPPVPTPSGSPEEIISAALDGCETVGIAFEDSLIGNEYLRTTRVACKEAGLRITADHRSSP